eukprot:9706536-Karenia_brevis.AAC.1
MVGRAQHEVVVRTLEQLVPFGETVRSLATDGGTAKSGDRRARPCWDHHCADSGGLDHCTKVSMVTWYRRICGTAYPSVRTTA